MLEQEINMVFSVMKDSIEKVTPAITDAKDIVASKG